MDGEDEGVYAWITANSVMGTIKASTPPDTPTYAVLDLGGASTQMVFEPLFASSDMQGEHKYDLQFGGRSHVLYQHSYLGYGLMRARRHVHRLVDFMSTLQGTKPKVVAGNLCLAKGTWRVLIVKDEATGMEREVTMDGGDIGSFEMCDPVVQLVLAKNVYVPFSSFLLLLFSSSSISLFHPYFLLLFSLLPLSVFLSHPLPSLFTALYYFVIRSTAHYYHTQD